MTELVSVEISLPVVRTIDVHEKKEKQTFVLARYNVTDYVSVDTVCQQRGGFLLTKTIMQDKLSTGFTDLVGDYPGTHTIELKNGNIRELDIRLVLRYKDFKILNNILKYSIATKLMELEDDGLYDLLLSFNKRV